jgi:hypothetical protein
MSFHAHETSSLAVHKERKTNGAHSGVPPDFDEGLIVSPSFGFHPVVFKKGCIVDVGGTMMNCNFSLLNDVSYFFVTPRG